MTVESYDQLAIFAVVAQERSFTRAAARLGMSQPALSRAMRQLEERLGVRLLARTTRSVAPTQAGEHLLQVIAPRFDEINSELALLSKFRDRPAGKLRITAGEHAAIAVLQPVLAKPLTISSSHIDKDYLELVTRDAALLTLNRSPSNLQYWMDAVLGITDPKTHGRMKAELMKIVSEQNGSNVSQYFTIEKLTVDPENATSEVNGTMHTVVGSKEVTAEARTFRYVWTYNGVSLKLAGFGRVKKDGEKGEVS